MRRSSLLPYLGIVTFVWFALAVPLSAQVGTGALTGTVEDATESRIPGVEVVATHAGTGSQTTVITNEAGVFSFPNLQRGTYTLSASLPSFQTQTFENIELGANQTLRYTFTLAVATTTTEVEVTVNASELAVQSGGTVGDVLPESSVRSLPLIGNDVLDLVNVLGGASVAGEGVMTFSNGEEAVGSRFTTLAGVSATYTNTTVNGVNVTDDYYRGQGEPDNTSGIRSITRLNPELVEEVRLVLTPVDAQLGRGNSQVQITTRSGTNEFHGIARWDVRNPALNARSWMDNRTPGGPPTEDWYNQNQITIGYGGPIIENQTFFYALWDQNINRQRTNVQNTVLTPCAQNGVFRYYPDWVNGNVNTQIPANPGNNAARPVVDVDGNPLLPDTFRDGSAYTEDLQYVSVFGPIDFGNFPAQVNADCSNIPVLNGSLAGANSPANAWDAERWNMDPTGFVSRVFDRMPGPNNYETGDGLNTAGFRWVRGRQGSDGGGFLGAVGTSSGNDTNRKQLNVKIDHSFNVNHKLSSQWSYQRDDAQIGSPSWENGFWGSVRRRPHTFSANLNSTLSATMVNEFTFGLRRTDNQSLEAMDSPTYGDAARAFYPAINGIPVIPGLPIVGNDYLMDQSNATQGNTTRQFSWGDVLYWTLGEHSFKFGGELRKAAADTFINVNLIPRLASGAGTTVSMNEIDFVDSTGSPTTGTFESLLDLSPEYGNGDDTHFQGGNLTNLQNLLLLQSGSFGNMTQYYFIKDSQQLDYFENITSYPRAGREWRQNEAALFFQDDWKVTRDLTLNLGLRWEYYGPPWENNGLMPAPEGTNLNGAFGMSGDSWDNWWQPPAGLLDGTDTVMRFVGRNSTNPDRSIYRADRNNLGPVFGFAWQVPWFGRGRTVLRGGYSVTFQGGGNQAALDGTAGELPGAILTASYGATPQTYTRLGDFGMDADALSTAALEAAGNFDFRDYPLPTVVPLPPQQLSPLDNPDPNAALKPMNPYPRNFNRSLGIPFEFFDDNYLSPYIQNFNLSVTRSLARNMTLDVRYIGTVARKLFTEVPINQPNFLYNGLQDAFDAARAGADSVPLLDQMFSAAPGFTGGNGAELLRSGLGNLGFTNLAENLARGEYAELANNLALTNGSGATAVPLDFPGQTGQLLIKSGVPDNFIVANPQLGNVNIVTNANSSNYHALQTQFTLRPTFGINYQGTLTWSKTLGSPTALNQGGGTISFFSYDRRSEDYGLQFSHRTLDFRSNGTFVLPLGPGKPFFGDTSGWVARAIEEWQLSAIFTVTSGAPMTIRGRSGLYESVSSSNFGFASANNAPPDMTVAGVDFFGSFLSDGGVGEVTWTDGADTGNYFDGFDFVRVPDPQCMGVANTSAGFGQTLRQRCLTGNAGLTGLARIVPAGTAGSFVIEDYAAGFGVPSVTTSYAGQTESAILVLQNAAPATRGNLPTNTLTGPGLWTMDASLSKAFEVGEDYRVQVRFDASNILNHAAFSNPAFGGGLGSNLDLNDSDDFALIGTKSALRPRQFQASVRVEF